MDKSEPIDVSLIFDGIKRIVSHRFDNGDVFYLVEPADENLESYWINHDEISETCAVRNYWETLNTIECIPSSQVDSIEVLGRIQGNHKLYYATDVQPDFGVHLFKRTQLERYNRDAVLEFLCTELKESNLF